VIEETVPVDKNIETETELMVSKQISIHIETESNSEHEEFEVPDPDQEMDISLNEKSFQVLQYIGGRIASKFGSKYPEVAGPPDKSTSGSD